MTYPSKIINFKVNVSFGTRSFSCSILIPENETFRIREIFEAKGYYIQKKYPLRRPPVVIDIGANVGVFTLFMKMVEPESIIHCYEPVPATVDLLRVNTSHFENILIQPFGLYNNDEEATIHIHAQNTGENSIKSKTPTNSDSAKVLLKDAGREIDSLNLDRIDIVKIDTEGCEVETLESLGSGRLENVDYLLIEYHSESDRRKIDQLLPRFQLFESKAEHLGVGVLKYINSRLINPA